MKLTHNRWPEPWKILSEKGQNCCFSLTAIATFSFFKSNFSVVWNKIGSKFEIISKATVSSRFFSCDVFEIIKLKNFVKFFKIISCNFVFEDSTKSSVNDAIESEISAQI